jgi:hypothetical protein
VLGDYWGSHYRDRPFYRDRNRWEGRHYVQPGPRYVEPQRPGFIGRGGDRFRDEQRRDNIGPRADQFAPRRDYATRPGEVRPRVEQPPPAAAPNSRAAQETQQELNQGGSSSVDPRLRPQY